VPKQCTNVWLPNFQTQWLKDEPLLMYLVTRAAADGNGSSSRQQLVSGVLRELSVAPCRWDARIERTVAGWFVLAPSVAFMPVVERGQRRRLV
jgi:hypothetical protein